MTNIHMPFIRKLWKLLGKNCWERMAKVTFGHTRSITNAGLSLFCSHYSGSLKTIKEKYILNVWKENIAFSLKQRSESTTFIPEYSASSVPWLSHPSRHSSSWVSAKHPRISFLPAKVSLNYRFWVACRSLLLSLLYFCR